MLHDSKYCSMSILEKLLLKFHKIIKSSYFEEWKSIPQNYANLKFLFGFWEDGWSRFVALKLI